MLKGNKVYIAIVTYNGIGYIEDCIHSINLYMPDAKILIYDNNSSDHTVAFLRGINRNIEIYNSDINLGFGAANNELMKYFIKDNGDFLILLNQDTRLVDDSFNHVIMNMNEHKSISIDTPIHFSDDNHTIDRLFNSYTLADAKSQNDPIFKSCFVNAACWILNSQTLLQLGGFNPLFFHYGEDRDYSNRLKYWGGTFKVHRSSRVIHNRDQEVKPTRFQEILKFKNGKNAYFLQILTNINRSLLLAYLLCYFKALGQIKKQLVIGEFSRATTILSLCLKYMKMAPEINTNRKKSKLQGAFIF